MSGHDVEPVARDAERHAFLDALARVQEGRPTLLLYEADAGLGENSLLDQLADSPYLPRRRIRVVRIPVPDRDPFDPAAIAARALASPMRTRIRAWLSGVSPSLRRIVPDWIGALPWGNLAGAILETTSALRRRKQTISDYAVADVLASARAVPVALFVDQLHRADITAIARLASLVAAADTGTRLLIVATTRPAGLGEGAAVFRALERVQPERMFRFRMLPDEQSDLDRWLGTLGSDAGRVLRTAAAAGPEFLGTVVARMAGEDELWTEDRLAECVRAGILVTTGDVELDGGEISTRYRFVSEATSAALVRGLDPSIRQTLAEKRLAVAQALGLQPSNG